MYINQLKDVSCLEIADTLKRDGYFFVEQVLTEQEVEQLLAEVNFERILINANDVGVVTSGTQKFLTHCLAKSKKAYDLITSRTILDICNAYFTKRYQLTNHRFCQTRKTFHMPWHTDNNLQQGGQLCGKHQMPGLLFLFYLSDENVSPFQYVKNSHTWSQQYDHEIYLSDYWVETHHRDDVLTFKMPKGSLIICDIHGIHRAAPFYDSNHVRNILLFQVDQVGDGYVGHGEQNLINTEFIDNLSEDLLNYLGFGVRRTYPAFPSSSAATMMIPDLLNLQKQLLPLTCKAAAKQIVKTLLPGEWIVGLKRICWTIKRMKTN
jgi:Phytanoyl-CoA dioxygenase (PhyH)